MKKQAFYLILWIFKILLGGLLLIYGREGMESGLLYFVPILEKGLFSFGLSVFLIVLFEFLVYLAFSEAIELYLEGKHIENSLNHKLTFYTVIGLLAFGFVGLLAADLEGSKNFGRQRAEYQLPQSDSIFILEKRLMQAQMGNLNEQKKEVTERITAASDSLQILNTALQSLEKASRNYQADLDYRAKVNQDGNSYALAVRKALAKTQEELDRKAKGYVRLEKTYQSNSIRLDSLKKRIWELKEKTEATEKAKFEQRIEIVQSSENGAMAYGLLILGLMGVFTAGTTFYGRLLKPKAKNDLPTFSEVQTEKVKDEALKPSEPINQISAEAESTVPSALAEEPQAEAVACVDTNKGKETETETAETETEISETETVTSETETETAETETETSETETETAETETENLTEVVKISENLTETILTETENLTGVVKNSEDLTGTNLTETENLTETVKNAENEAVKKTTVFKNLTELFKAEPKILTAMQSVKNNRIKEAFDEYKIESIEYGTFKNKYNSYRDFLNKNQLTNEIFNQ